MSEQFATELDAIAVLRITADAQYPTPIGGYAPGQTLAELPHSVPVARDNQVYSAVRDCLIDAGLDARNLGTPQWNPLSDFVGQGGRVFVLCNFCYHRRPWETESTFASKCTHGAVLRPILDYARKAVGPSGTVEFGNSPIQSTDWDAVLNDTGASHVLSHLADSQCEPSVQAIDLRSWVLKGQLSGQDQSSPKTTIDLGAHSLLEACAATNREYRILQYDPSLTARYHGKNRHLYVISRRILDADLIISVPKLKVHQKVGVTLALKGMVGTIPDKDCLAHHRRGTPAQGGDEFPENRLVARLASHIGDRVWRRDASRLLRQGRYAERALGILARRLGLITYGGWHGNDTAWRMALDIARCVRSADSEGRLHSTKQRNHIVLVDGIVGGEGEGPLDPTPVPSRCVIFARDPLVADVVASHAMGLDPHKIQMLARAVGIDHYPVSSERLDQVRVKVDGGDAIAVEDLAPVLGKPFRVPTGWQGAIELD